MDIVEWMAEQDDDLASHVEDWLRREKRMGSIKRAPTISSEVRREFRAISKADWVELYFDLYRQCFGETVPDEECMRDAQKRLEIVKANREV